MARGYVGIDLHRRRSAIVRLDALGEVIPALLNEPGMVGVSSRWEMP